MTSHVTFFQLSLLVELSQLNTFLQFLQKHNFLECQISVVSSRDPSRDFFYSRWVSPPNQASRVVSTTLAIYNKVVMQSNKINS